MAEKPKRRGRTLLWVAGAGAIAMCLCFLIFIIAGPDTEEATPTSEQATPTSAPEIPTEVPTDVSNVKFDYTEEERKEIFFERVKSEDRAQAEAESLFPTPDPLSSDYSSEAEMEALQNQFAYFDEMAPVYREEVAERYGLTVEQLDEIGNEGTINGWPMPPVGISQAVEECEPSSNAVDTVAKCLVPNDLGIIEQNLLTMENPLGEGIFIYVKETRYFGVERLFGWVGLNGSAYPLNGATKGMLTPGLPYPREAPPGDWERTGLDLRSATQAIEIIWGE